MSKKQPILRDLIMGSDTNPHEYALTENTTYALGLSPKEELKRHWDRYRRLIDKRSLDTDRYGFIRFFEGYNHARRRNLYFEEMAKYLSRFQLEIRVEQHGRVIVRQISEKSFSAVVPPDKRKPIREIRPTELRDYLLTIGEEAVVSEGCLLVCGYNYFLEFGKPIDSDAEKNAEHKWRVSHDTQVFNLKELGLA